MDILAHALWAGVGVALLRRRAQVAPRTVVLTLGLAVLPDLVHLLPIVGWSVVGNGSVGVLGAYAVALPGQEPAMPAIVTLLAHHLHCIGHSAVVAGVVTLLLWNRRRVSWIPLLGWWSHIVIDVFTHSADYYPSPVLYPVTRRGFDGIAWNTPWFIVLNYTVLVCLGLWLWTTRTRRSTQPSAPPVPQCNGVEGPHES